MDRQKALAFLYKNIENKNIIKHMLATEAMMGVLFDALMKKGETIAESKEEWMMAGLLHDGDYMPNVPEHLQGVKVSEMVYAEGIVLSESVKHCMAAHNSATGVAPESVMDWALFCGDSLTGLIVASALVQPDKKLSSVSVESVMKKFKDPSFAKGTRRDEIQLCEGKLGFSLSEFIRIVLGAMQAISAELGL